jgi:hypothetical protein
VVSAHDFKSRTTERADTGRALCAFIEPIRIFIARATSNSINSCLYSF